MSRRRRLFRRLPKVIGIVYEIVAAQTIQNFTQTTTIETVSDDEVSEDEE